MCNHCGKPTKKFVHIKCLKIEFVCLSNSQSTLLCQYATNINWEHLSKLHAKTTKDIQQRRDESLQNAFIWWILWERLHHHVFSAIIVNVLHKMRITSLCEPPFYPVFQC